MSTCYDPPIIRIVVSGGVVQDVETDDPDLVVRVQLIDLDNDPGRNVSHLGWHQLDME